MSDSKTNFFSQIMPFLEGQKLEIVLEKVGDKITVYTYPDWKVSDASKSEILPISFSATPELLDIGYFHKIAEPLDKSKQSALSIQQFEQSIERAKSQSELAKTEKSQKQKLIEAEGKEMIKAKDLIKEDKLRQAIAVLDKIIDADPKREDAKTLRKETAAQLLAKDGDMFATTKN
ncbi:MAG: PRTRC system protein E [Reichenbachiella sp.]|uniref:PRTRC system protein E n=1 Tax=Reichenbachiella sp. TaxID=2184521 RepID=UPI003296FDBE